MKQARSPLFSRCVREPIVPDKQKPWKNSRKPWSLFFDRNNNDQIIFNNRVNLVEKSTLIDDGDLIFSPPNLSEKISRLKNELPKVFMGRGFFLTELKVTLLLTIQYGHFCLVFINPFEGCLPPVMGGFRALTASSFQIRNVTAFGALHDRLLVLLTNRKPAFSW